jgi:hypothetical protein
MEELNLGISIAKPNISVPDKHYGYNAGANCKDLHWKRMYFGARHCGNILGLSFPRV